MPTPPLLSSTLAALFAVLCATPTALAIEDTPENRIIEAARYLDATPPQEMFSNIAEQMAKNMPESEREPYKALLTRHLDIPALT